MLEFGKKIKALRQQKGWSQGDVAQRLGISVAAFSKIETDVTDISVSRLLQIADVFEQSVAQIILPSDELDEGEAKELEQARETIKNNQEKIVSLQEYIITLYEEIHKIRRQSGVLN